MARIDRRCYGNSVCLLIYRRFGWKEIVGFSEVKVGQRVKRLILFFGQFLNGRVVIRSFLTTFCML